MSPGKRRWTTPLLIWAAAVVAVSATLTAEHLLTPDTKSAAIPSSTPEPAHETPKPPSEVENPVIADSLTAPVLGVALNVHHVSRLDRYLASVDRIADLGANSMILLTPMWMENVHASSIRLLPERCPTDDQLIAILTRAKKRGLATVLLPVVLLEEAGPKEWRGVIEPDDWDAWWSSYDEFLDRHIRIANEAEVDVLGVGSELNSTEAKVKRWGAAIERVRERYDGRILYSANWDRFEYVAFWPLVDVMGISAYFELAEEGETATDAALVAAWADARDELLAAAREHGRPLLLTEVGYPSLPTAAAHPWDYTNRAGLDADPDLQARCWQAFLTAWRDAFADPDNSAMGFFYYHWDPYHRGGPEDTGYGMAGKPTLDVIRRGFREIRSNHERDSEIESD